jgi:hypothetical protein
MWLSVLTQTCPGPPPVATVDVGAVVRVRVVVVGCSTGVGVGVTGFKMNQGFLAGVGVAAVVSPEGVAADVVVAFLGLRSFAGEGDAVVTGVVAGAPKAVFRLPGDGDTVPAGVTLGVAAALWLRRAAGDGDSVLAAVVLLVAVSFF